MDVGFVKRQIKNKELDNFYIFTGDEAKVQTIYLNKISEVTNKQIERIDAVSELYTKKKSLFDLPKLYVCMDDKDFIKTEKAWNNLDSVLGKNMLIFLWTSVDKRTKFYKQFEDKVVVFELLRDELLLKYGLKQIKLTKPNMIKLIHICENSYSRLLLEIDKINNYVTAKQVKPDEAFSILIEEGTIYIPPQDAIFDYVDAVLRGNINLSYDLLEECNRIGEPPLRLITVLYSGFKRLLQVQACDSDNIQESTGLQWWEIKNVKDKVGCWKTGELVYVLKLLRGLEKGIKSGTIEEQFVMDYFMVNIF